MEDRVKALGHEFVAAGAETSGALTPASVQLLKKLSEIAHKRKGHDKRVFMRKWVVRLGMILAKRGAQEALARTLAVSGERKGHFAGSGVPDEPMVSEDAEPALVAVPSGGG